ncbi:MULTISPECIES: 1-deoxy-D-xylulose-5-phosphate reductoisomerase [Alteromonadaceae]|uniref:1-deoxy-D-xylulose-5-phosphate reductoisomerase n=1 Tax=Alteromonadaceae TaxID=72275 RepID=UPI001C0861EC|nr:MULTISPECIES: 1-deoxy-D-xylulose-5-phosphate reductoisomerase [Aliiglaciecola]MBU2879652.1 1-deoxy-D-xylulose-5-phosphate reductoisomerase [Aliiglaciecola lipolytica]MDO6710069.1 1-deoxy-D-xylulose-5-phosphate reductoisomerase [Aliiglaciecola sp. 2_MG-2023]MDO6751217.1 1-deoxy-D-xylulose-5-phosphate reductoisomerase [Aliiglaciecola sp. 1_MG-2023]
MQNIAILGATGSIGQSTLDVIQLHPEKYNVVALTAHSSVDKLISQAILFQPNYLVISDLASYTYAKQALQNANLKCELLVGQEGLCQVASDSSVDSVMAAIVGAAGLLPTLAAVKSGKKVMLANKESLVMCGDIFIQEVNKTGAQLLPIDSEHNAIFQCLPADFKYGDLAASGIAKILLTGSGGPFLNRSLDTFVDITPDQACAHPNWDMGRKISVDSATMMNKGLEFIEAKWLFGLNSADIQIVLHPQSIIHSMVQYADGSVLAQMGNPDMKTPIAHCLAFPNRINAGVTPLDFAALADFSFQVPDLQRYPNLKLAINACDAGQYATTALNAANEIAVEAFLSHQIGFSQIAEVNEEMLQRIEAQHLQDIDGILGLDKQVRSLAKQFIGTLV